MYHHRTPYLVKPSVRVPSLAIRYSNFSLDSRNTSEPSAYAQRAQTLFRPCKRCCNKLDKTEEAGAIIMCESEPSTREGQSVKVCQTRLLSLPKPMLCAPTTQAKLRCCIADHSGHVSTGVVLFTTGFSASLSSPTPQVCRSSSTAAPPIASPIACHLPIAMPRKSNMLSPNPEVLETDPESVMT
jgi:hypothetical protein